jgi:hypothetical protein
MTTVDEYDCQPFRSNAENDVNNFPSVRVNYKFGSAYMNFHLYSKNTYPILPKYHLARVAAHMTNEYIRPLGVGGGLLCFFSTNFANITSIMNHRRLIRLRQSMASQIIRH